MNLWDAILLGLIQGLTEFLPISSSGHLVITQRLLGADAASAGALSFEILVHLGTLLAVFVFFRKQIFRLVRAVFDPGDIEGRKLALWVVVGTVPAVIAGLFLKKMMVGILTSAQLASALLVVNGFILLSTGWAKRGADKVRAKSGMLIGVAQAFAILPGISRSGSTISAGMFLGVAPEKAAEFSFLLAIPAILGAAVLDLKSLGGLESDALLTYLVGAGVAFASGLASIGWLMRLIRGGKFLYFGVYCLLAGAVSIYLVNFS